MLRRYAFINFSNILQKFGVRIDADKKQKIIEGRFQYINDIMGKLFDFDNGGGIHSQHFQDGNNSEINYIGGTGADKDNSFIGVDPPLKNKDNLYNGGQGMNSKFIDSTDL